MSTIGPGSFGPFNVAGSFAGAQRNNADADRVKETAAARAAQVDQQAAAAHGNDVSEADLSSDRDADGRLPYVMDEAVERDEEAADDQEQSARVTDPEGERGLQLDLEA